MEYSAVQNIARQTIDYIKRKLTPGMTLLEVRNLCERKMLELGADSFWYWDIGAFCFSGDETTVSVSGRNYKTSERIVLADDIVTIDLSPQVGNIWGDFARTIVLEDGCVVDNVGSIRNTVWKNGLLMEESLHSEMKRFVTTDTTFEALYYHMNAYIQTRGYVNLDFSGNLGHSVVKRKEDRIYIEKGNNTKLSSAAMFTFEPHISVPGSSYGFKKENIYFFADDVLHEL